LAWIFLTPSFLNRQGALWPRPAGSYAYIPSPIFF
jgi:hypothetical protein